MTDSSRYEVFLLKRAQKELRKLDPQTRNRIRPAILNLGSDPRPHGARKLSGSDSTYRIRVGDYRVLYEIEDDKLLVLVVRVGHRRDIYR